jgi:hypothetical protein
MTINLLRLDELLSSKALYFMFLLFEKTLLNLSVDFHSDQHNDNINKELNIMLKKEKIQNGYGSFLHSFNVQYLILKEAEKNFAVYI